MRPDPPDPSTHVNVNSFPVTKRSPASAFMFCARAGPLATKLATKATNRAIIPIALQIPSQRLRNQPLITRFRTSVPNFHPRSTGEQIAHETVELRVQRFRNDRLIGQLL